MRSIVTPHFLCNPHSNTSWGLGPLSTTVHFHIQIESLCVHKSALKYENPIAIDLELKYSSATDKPLQLISHSDFLWSLVFSSYLVYLSQTPSVSFSRETNLIQVLMLTQHSNPKSTIVENENTMPVALVTPINNILLLPSYSRYMPSQIIRKWTLNSISLVFIFPMLATR